MRTERLPSRIADHPTVRKVRSRATRKPAVIEADWLRRVCLDAGADDVAFGTQLSRVHGGFTGWAQTIADSENADCRSRFSDSENASMWQSLSFKANYKAAYCLAVCPAGEDVIEPYPDDRKGFMDLVLKPLQDKAETLYVLPGSAAKDHAERRFPHKRVKVVDSGISGR
jgi:epoxyqueuosine reductase